MSNGAPLPLPQNAQAYRQGHARGAVAVRAPLPPLIEQALRLTFFAGGAGFWIALIW
jgi:hypothetical protein